jgi:hypothetical protein
MKVKDMYNELKGIEREGRLLKQVHRLRKAVIWKKIAEISINQERELRQGVSANRVIDNGKIEFEFLLNELKNEIERFHDEKKK